MDAEKVAPLASEYEFMVKKTFKKPSKSMKFENTPFPKFIAAEETFLSRPIPDPTHPGARYVVRANPSLRLYRNNSKSMIYLIRRA